MSSACLLHLLYVASIRFFYSYFFVVGMNEGEFEFYAGLLLLLKRISSCVQSV